MTASTASMVESIRFEREALICPNITDKYAHIRSRYTIRWTDPDGRDYVETEFWCWHPLCDVSPWVALADLPPRPQVLVTTWLTHNGKASAVAYILRVFDGGLSDWEAAARIGIIDQWEDPQYGNHPGQLFSERFYANEGSGVYPAKFV